MTIKIVNRDEPLEYPDRCQYDDCQNPVEAIAYDREAGEIGFYCHEHCDTIVSKEDPEYIEGCPNCGCKFGVN
jgi:hypothetical protein